MKVTYPHIVMCVLLSIGSQVITVQAMQEIEKQALEAQEKEMGKLFPQTRETDLALKVLTSPASTEAFYGLIVKHIRDNNSKGALDTLRRGVKYGFNVNYQDTQDAGSTLLHEAARHGKSDILRALLEVGADPDVKDQHGRTPLFDAVSAKDLDSVNALIAADAQVNTVDAKGQPLLHHAVQLYTIPIVQALLASPNVNLLITNSQGKTAYQTIKSKIIIGSGLSLAVQAAMKRLLANTCTKLTDMCIRVITENAEEFTTDDLEQLPAEVLEKFPVEIKEQLNL